MSAPVRLAASFLSAAVANGKSFDSIKQLAAATRQHSTVTCPSGFTTHSAGGKTFCRTTGTQTWPGAVSACQGIGMQLVEITTAAKAAIVDSWCEYDCGWIGLSCPSATPACDSDLSLWSWSVHGSSVSSTYSMLTIGGDGTIYGGGPAEHCAHWWYNGGHWAPGTCSHASYRAICEEALTPAPTMAPTPAPTTSAPAAGGSAAATGDPHLQNVYGERFDLMRPGRHVLIHIPRGDPAERALLRVEAEARRLGGQCADMYFTELNITGAWVRARQGGGLSLAEADLSLVEARQASSLLFKALGAHEEHPEWMKLGRVDLKVVHGRTQQGLAYLNFYVRHLGRAGFAVGGLLGEDDHTEAATPSGACARRSLSLLQM